MTGKLKGASALADIVRPEYNKDLDALKARVTEILHRHGLDHRIDWVQGGKPFLTRRGRLVEVLARVVERVSGVTPEVNCTGGTSDGRFIFDICPEVAEFGPVRTKRLLAGFVYVSSVAKP